MAVDTEEEEMRAADCGHRLQSQDQDPHVWVEERTALGDCVTQRNVSG